MTTALADLPLVASGKVREMYDLGDRLLMVASDRISTYDVVHPTPIPDKGKVLTGLSVFWFEQTSEIVPTASASATEDVPPEARGRALSVMKLDMLPVECVVRGYLTGSGWKDYGATGAVAGISCRPACATPSSCRADLHAVDEGRRSATTRRSTSPRRSRWSATRRARRRLRDVSIDALPFAADHARSVASSWPTRSSSWAATTAGCWPRRRGADAGLVAVLAGRHYELGRGQPTFDKQYVRDWAANTGWDKKPPAPAIPEDVVAGTRDRYVEAYEKITGLPFSGWLERVAP